jgi:hypothetical protein
MLQTLYTTYYKGNNMEDYNKTVPQDINHVLPVFLADNYQKIALIVAVPPPNKPTVPSANSHTARIGVHMP